MFKKIPFVLYFLLIFILLTSCNKGIDSMKIIEANQNNLMLEEETVSKSNIDALNDYSFEMAKDLSLESGDSNFVVSPISLWMPLAALGNAANDTVINEHLNSLKFADKNLEEINLFAAKLLYELNNEDYRRYSEENNMEFVDSLYMANALFLNKEYEANMEFVDAFYNYYKGTTMLVDFQSDEAKDEVNEWVYNNTEGNIEDIVDEFDPKTVAALANTIFFKGKWENEFDESLNEYRTFNGYRGEIDTEFMIMNGIDDYYSQGYYEDDEIQAVDFPYTNNAGMIIILPKDKSVNDVFNELDTEYFNKVNDESKLKNGITYLPKFKIQSDTMNLMNVMRNMGVPLLDGYIDGLALSQNDLYISDAYQKAMIEVNEEGTTAAAATIVEVMETAIEPTDNDTFVLNCNKPFIFILYGDVTGNKEILFLGILMSP